MYFSYIGIFIYLLYDENKRISLEGEIVSEYFAARKGHINLEELKITYRTFKDYFVDTYLHFEQKGYFKLAFEGIYSTPKLMAPSPEAYIFTHVGKSVSFPLDHNYRHDQVTTFTLIEILYKYICKEEGYEMYYKDEAQLEFRTMINKFLLCLDNGYVLTEMGYIIDLPEDGLGQLITQDLPENTEDSTTEKVETAIKMFFKYDSNESQKAKAINILADILEPYRKELKNETTENHDTLIFSIVNKYGIRHNTLTQKTDYNKPIWYEWMFHYYLATVHATLKLGLKKS